VPIGPVAQPTERTILLDARAIMRANRRPAIVATIGFAWWLERGQQPAPAIAQPGSTPANSSCCVSGPRPRGSLPGRHAWISFGTSWPAHLLTSTLTNPNPTADIGG